MPTENKTSIDMVNHRHNQPISNLLSYTREQLVQIRQQTRQNNLLGLPWGSIKRHSKTQNIQEKTQNQKQKIIKNSTVWDQF